ncbi:MAG TPA: hypothetical protein VLW26_01065, partial [Steroidobacteraceae bacterium]|nr:hypothetical protein [Steroidobacteraceae bacterium]
MLGRFLELSVPTADIRASVEFYERLGFSHAATGDIWNYPYGVVTDGRITLGLHQNVRREPAITFVRAGVARHASELERVGYRIAYRRTGAEEFHEVGLRDPGGALVTVLEARTYSPVDRRPEQLPHCGYFAELTLPQPNFAAA